MPSMDVPPWQNENASIKEQRQRVAQVLNNIVERYKSQRLTRAEAEKRIKDITVSGCNMINIPWDES